MKFTTAIFDMDGVIIDTEPLHKWAYHKMFENFGLNIEPEMYNSFTGKSTLDICSFLCEKFHVLKRPENLVDCKRSFFKKAFSESEDLCLLPNVLELIENYNEHNIEMVLASSASYNTINAVFERFGLNDYFTHKISGTDFQHSKPHPAIFQHASDVSRSKKNSCFVIEDSTNGFKASKSANIKCIAYKSEHSQGQDYSYSDHLISDFKEIFVENFPEI